MKNLFTLVLISIFTLTSCSSDGEIGPPGPQGPQGPPGEDGLIGTVFDVSGDFTAENNYSLLFEYSDYTDVEVFESDLVLVYLRVGQDGTADGEPVYVWRQLPQTYYEDGGTVQYNFDYTFFSVNIFLDSNMELSSIRPAFTQDQSFRIAILPAGFDESAVDITSYKSVMSALGIQEEDIPEFHVNQ